MVEKMDAHSMVAWSSAVLGDLEDADRISAAGLAQVQPGQVPAWTLHLVAWRTYVLALLGRWDEAISLGERARHMWLEADRPSAGYAIRGFIALIDVAQARQDERLAEQHREILRAIISEFPGPSRFRNWIDYGSSDLDALERAVMESPVDRTAFTERLERSLSRLSDAGRQPPLDKLQALEYRAMQGPFRPLLAQVKRAQGLLQRDPDLLESSLTLFDQMAAQPYAARVRCERALAIGDEAELKRGLDVLRQVGDQQQISRYERLRVG
jgi:hypothetical protein